MEFKITRENFLIGLSKTQSVVEKKNTMPVLSNVLLEADKNGLKISATDMEVAIVYQTPAQVLKPGKITVPCRSIYDIVREIAEMELHLTLKENGRIEVRAGRSLFTIPGLSAAEFPALPKVEAQSVEIPCDRFLEMVEKTSFSMSADETRHTLAGVLLQKTGPSIRMVATDGHRLSLVERDLGNIGPVKVIIPRKGVGELRKIVAAEGSFELAVGSKNLFARKGNETLYVRLIDGEYPDYERVIPKGNDKKAMIPREKFVGALRRVSLFSNERSRGVVMNLSSGHLELSISNPDLGEAREEFDAAYKGEKLSIGFNARYFLDALGAIKDDSVILALQNDLSPCMIKAQSDDSFLSVVMPMRI